jgi:hypothetical protein
LPCAPGEVLSSCTTREAVAHHTRSRRKDRHDVIPQWDWTELGTGRRFVGGLLVTQARCNRHCRRCVAVSLAGRRSASATVVGLIFYAFLRRRELANERDAFLGCFWCGRCMNTHGRIGPNKHLASSAGRHHGRPLASLMRGLVSACREGCQQPVDGASGSETRWTDRHRS